MASAPSTISRCPPSTPSPVPLPRCSSPSSRSACSGPPPDSAATGPPPAPGRRPAPRRRPPHPYRRARTRAGRRPVRHAPPPPRSGRPGPQSGPRRRLRTPLGRARPRLTPPRSRLATAQPAPYRPPPRLSCARPRPGRGPPPSPRLGLWPAAAGLLAFTWLELVSPDPASTTTLLLFLALYTAVHLAGAARHGAGWFDRADAFEVYSGLLARLSPLGRRPADRRLVLRSPFNGLDATPQSPGLVATVCVMLGSTAYDGFSDAPSWITTVQTSPLGRTTAATLGLWAPSPSSPPSTPSAPAPPG